MKDESLLSRTKLHFEDLPETVDWIALLRNQRRRAVYKLKKLRPRLATSAFSSFVKN